LKVLVSFKKYPNNPKFTLRLAFRAPYALLVTIGVSGAIEMSCYTYTYTYTRWKPGFATGWVREVAQVSIDL